MGLDVAEGRRPSYEAVVGRSAQQMRSAFGPALLGSVERLDPVERGAILSRVGATVREHYATAMAIGWTDMAVHMKLSDAIRAVIGPDRNEELWREAMAHMTDRPLLSGFLRHVGARFGVDPGSIYTQTARLWQHLCRGIGELEATVDGRSARAELKGFPVDDHQFICFVEGTHGCLRGIVSPLNVEPEVTRIEVNLERGNVSYDIRW